MNQVIKEFRFESAHRLSKYVGKCQRIHGHNYRGLVYAEGELDELGMVMDFSDLKALIKEIIIEPLDHRLILQRADEMNEELHNTASGEESIVFVDYNPTAENMAQDFLKQLKERDPRIKKVILYETDDSFAIAE